METIELPTADDLRKTQLDIEHQKKQQAGWNKIKRDLVITNKGGRRETTFYQHYMLTRYCLPIQVIAAELKKKGYEIKTELDGFGNIFSITVCWY